MHNYTLWCPACCYYPQCNFLLLQYTTPWQRPYNSSTTALKLLIIGVLLLLHVVGWAECWGWYGEGYAHIYHIITVLRVVGQEACFINKCGMYMRLYCSVYTRSNVRTAQVQQCRASILIVCLHLRFPCSTHRPVTRCTYLNSSYVVDCGRIYASWISITYLETH